MYGGDLKWRAVDGATEALCQLPTAISFKALELRSVTRAFADARCFPRSSNNC